MKFDRFMRRCRVLSALSLVLAGAAQAQLGPQRGNTPVRPPVLPPNASQPNNGTGRPNNAPNFLPPGIDLVAGVRFDKPAEMPSGINDLKAAAYDPIERRLYLIGQSKVRLPAFRLEDLAVALKALHTAYPAVSIEGPITDGQMTVKYFGGIENTKFGDVLFEADRLLKCLALGKDNVTKKYLQPHVLGFESEVRKLQRMGGAQRPKAWHRYWFRPAQVSMTASEDGRVLRFDTVKIEVKTEYVPAIADGESEPAAEEFAQHFTDHFDEFAAQYPIFEELRQCAKVAALAQWLKESNIPLSSLELEKAVVPVIDTPKTTPVGYAQAMSLLPEGLMKHQMQGGVSLKFVKQTFNNDGTFGSPGNWSVTRTGPPVDLLKSILKKPSPETSRWFAKFTASLAKEKAETP